MKYVLVDSSIWVDFFRTGQHENIILHLIGRGLLATCGLIKAELVPFFKSSQKKEVEHYLHLATHLPFEDNDWTSLIEWKKVLLNRGEQTTITDLIIMVIAKQKKARILTMDSDFKRAQKIMGYELFNNNSYE